MVVKTHPPLGSLQILVVSIARQIFDCQRSDFFGTGPKTPKINISVEMITFDFFGHLNFFAPLPYGRGSVKNGKHGGPG